MNTISQPLVSIVTPVYNGAKYISECIESVLSQTYQNWEYIIVNNCSTDNTLEIVQSYAKSDVRIRVYDNNQFLNAIENHNYALRLISPESKYCKILHADDYLFPDCIMQMVLTAEKEPSIGIVSSYAIHGEKVREDKVPYPKTIIPGKEACRLSLLTGSYLFGTTPSTVLIRSDLIRKKEEFYINYLHADLDACFEILQETDFGFVHQILTYSRIHNESRSSFADRVNAYIPAYLFILKKYGHLCLSPEDFDLLLKTKMKSYYRFLGRSLLKRREKEFWTYHQRALEEIGFRLNYLRLGLSTIRFLISQIFNRLWAY